MQKGMKLFGVLSIILAIATAWLLRGTIQQIRSATVVDTQSKQPIAEQKKAAQESPFACNLLALDAAGRQRHKTVSQQMHAAVKEVRELSDGYAFRFPAEQDNILLVSEFIARERLCCPFFRFELVAEQEGGPLWLQLRGREGVKEFIRAELGIRGGQ
jgi:hypothetical protein